jgi:RNA polymerase sigma factor (sigma-70 family)
MPEQGTPPGESTASLLEQVRSGAPDAKDRLVQRYLPALRRWARGRMPTYARDLADTDDLVQITLMRALDKVQAFEHRGEGSFLAYLRRTLQNQIRDQLRAKGRRPVSEEVTGDMSAVGPSPLEDLIGRQALEAYDAALEQLPAAHQEAVMLRVEMGFTYPDIAEAIGAPSPNAARMTVARALARLAEVMNARS